MSAQGLAAAAGLRAGSTHIYINRITLVPLADIFIYIYILYIYYIYNIYYIYIYIYARARTHTRTHTRIYV